MKQAVRQLAASEVRAYLKAREDVGNCVNPVARGFTEGVVCTAHRAGAITLLEKQAADNAIEGAALTSALESVWGWWQNP
jgi:hypothetical protein